MLLVHVPYLKGGLMGVEPPKESLLPCLVPSAKKFCFLHAAAAATLPLLL